MAKQEEFALISPSGKIIRGTSLNKVARAYGVNRNGLKKLTLRDAEEYKGWRLLETGRAVMSTKEREEIEAKLLRKALFA